MYINGQNPLNIDFNIVRQKMNIPKETQVKVNYIAHARLPMLHGGFLPHTFETSAVFSCPNNEFSVSQAKSALEAILIRKYRARRIRWAKFEVIEID